MSEQELLKPVFEKAYWRSEQRFLFRKHPQFSSKKKHFEPEEHSSFAERFAEQLTLEDSREEICRIYENCVTLLKNKRSKMERGDRSLEAAQFRFTILAGQDPVDPASILVSRHLLVKTPLNELPPHFDDLFPWKASEIVIPFESQAGHRELLEILEHWEELLGGRIEESADQNLLRLHLPSGFSMGVNLACRELSFLRSEVEGVVALAAAVAGDLKALGMRKALS